MTPPPGSAIVVGAGAFGAATALELRSRAWDVTLVDRAAVPHPDASSTDISKMIRMDYGSDVFYHELAEAALDGWDRWNHEWPRPLYHEESFLVLAPEPMRPGGFEYESFRVLRERGYDPQRLDRETLAEHFPAWAADRYPDGYVSPRGGWAESGAVVERLLLSCQERGVEQRIGRFEALLERGSTVTGIRIDNGDTLEADQVIVSAGAWTPVLLPWLSEVLRPVAQPVVHFAVEPSEYRAPRFPPFAADTSGSGWYGFPALPDGRLKLGHHGDGRAVHPDDRGQVDASHIRRARAFLAGSIPALAEAPVVGTRVCLYCDSFDGDLLVDRDPNRRGLVVASGGSGHGFKFAPVLGDIVADVVEGKENRWAPRFGWRTGGPPKREQARLQETP